MNLKKIFFVFWGSFIFLVSFFSCKKEDKFITSKEARISFSKDTMHFDTVFTTVGSTTQLVKIFNNNNQKLNLTNVKLMGGAASFYKMNVDGTSGTNFSNIELAANDSVYVYCSINVNPSSANLPFIIQDSVQVQYNGNTKFIQLVGYGQNAIFLKNQKITGNVTWSNTLPYVLLERLWIDTTATLTIPKGTKIYAHANAPIVVDGTLITNGTSAERIVFTGDRLDAPYKNFPASWPGILFRQTSKNNVLQYTNIKNAYQAVIVNDPSSNANPKLTLNECEITNAYDAGIFALNTEINAKNCLITNCGTNIGITLGGTYNFSHCTVASYSNANIVHSNPVLLATNYLKSGNTVFVAPITANFSNCIFWGEFGTTEDEVVVDKAGTNPFTINFVKCLYKVKTGLNTLVTNTNGIMNIPPLFDSINTGNNFYNFRLKQNSPALNVGAVSSITNDLDGKPRPVGLPDLGCYEKQ